MSLNWNITKIDRAVSRTPNGDLSPITHAMIWATMLVGIGRITERNVGTFYRRIHIAEMTLGALLIQTDARGEGVMITLDDVRRHVGLSTNVRTETDAAWLKRFWTMTEGWTAALSKQPVTPLPVEAK